MSPEPVARKAPARKAAAKATPTTKAAPAKATPTTNATPAKKASPVDKATPAKKASPAEKATSATKVSPVKKAAPAKKATPRKAAVPKQAAAEPPSPAPTVTPPAAPAPVPAPPPVTTPSVAAPTAAEAWQITGRLLDHPAYAPELLATMAVRLIGPRAATWVEATRAAYPAATEAGLARLATRRFVRLAAAGGAVAHVAGLFAPVAELATVALTQAGLALHLAAAYGHDPVHPDRAADLLVLTQVHADEKAAQAALAAAEDAQKTQKVPNGTDEEAPPLARAAEAGARLAVPLAAQTGGWLALRLVARVVPGARLLVAGAGSAAAAERLAARAAAHYREQRPIDPARAS